MKNYFEYKGVYFSEGTPTKLRDLLLKIKDNNTRVVLGYGDTKTNESWGESFDITGRIRKSTGTKPILILVHNTRSTGGGAILTDCIINIKTSIGKASVYTNKIV